MGGRQRGAAGLTPRPPLHHVERGSGAEGMILAPYGPAAAQGDGRRVLRRCGLAGAYTCQGDMGVEGRPAVLFAGIGIYGM